MTDLNLNLPALDQLRACRNLLIAGMGGGFDLYAGLPLYFELERRRINLHLASLSLRDITRLESGPRLSETLAGLSADYAGRAGYFPELHLVRWFQQRLGEAVTVWCFHKTGVRTLAEDYRRLVEHLSVDGLLLVGGGVAPLLRGDEAQAPAMEEAWVSLLAAGELPDVPVRIMACLGLGAEPDAPYAEVFENMAALARDGAFLGSCALARPMAVYQLYQDAVLYAQEQPYQQASVVDSAVISAVEGAYGDYHLTDATRGTVLHISPLISLYWFFDAAGVAARHLLTETLGPSHEYMEAYRAAVQARRRIERRPSPPDPLP